ncbi:hypothetical protein A9Q78_11765 [Methylophaga sp. 41_12_T18]|nr:hypothetical protein A9Q78_11765 [Methylophaga sp. 41_12_T18]
MVTILKMHKILAAFFILILVPTSYIAAEFYDTSDFIEHCKSTIGLSVDSSKSIIEALGLTSLQTENDGIILIQQVNMLLSNRFCLLHHLDGNIVDATWK